MTNFKADKLKEISEQVKICKKCELYKHSTHAVPGEGEAGAEIMFIGEGPGFHEDNQGRPFVGQAGKLLDSLLEMIGVRRADVFIANVIKHRPPENRDPEPAEIAACGFWLDEQIKIIQPKMVVTLGRFSMTKFIPGAAISKIHGQARVVDFENFRFLVLPMYHPAAALRNGAVLEELKRDFKKIQQLLDEARNVVKNNETSKQIELFSNL